MTLNENFNKSRRNEENKKIRHSVLWLASQK